MNFFSEEGRVLLKNVRKLKAYRYFFIWAGTGDSNKRTGSATLHNMQFGKPSLFFTGSGFRLQL